MAKPQTAYKIIVTDKFKISKLKIIPSKVFGPLAFCGLNPTIKLNGKVSFILMGGQGSKTQNGSSNTPGNLMEVSTDHTVEELHSFVKESGGLVVIDCYAPWCAPCKRLAMLLPKMAKDHKKVQFIKVNADQNNNIAQFFKVRSFPNVIFLKEDGNGGVCEVARVVGLNLEKIKSLLKEHE